MWNEKKKMNSVDKQQQQQFQQQTLHNFFFDINEIHAFLCDLTFKLIEIANEINHTQNWLAQCWWELFLCVSFHSKQHGNFFILFCFFFGCLILFASYAIMIHWIEQICMIQYFQIECWMALELQQMYENQFKWYRTWCKWVNRFLLNILLKFFLKWSKWSRLIYSKSIVYIRSN